jgi:phage shock protein C
LAQRAQQRALRKEEQAQDAAERSERLAERAQRRPKREKDLDQSIEDLVDQVAEKWTRKAEDWIDGQSDRIFNNDSNDEDEDEDEDEDLDAEFEQVESELDDDLIDAARPRPRKRTSQRNGSSRRVYSTKNESRKRRRKKRSYGYAWNSENWDWGHYGRRSSRRASRKRRRGNLYRDTRNKKICGVCAGTAEYMGMETWHVRLIAVMGLIFIPTVAMTVYFVTYFLMDKKPYYRQVTDRFDDLRNNTEEERPTVRRRNRSRTDEKPEVTNREAMRVAKEKFGDIEQRLRCMETAVTSSTFELQRELSKISGEDN